MAPIFKTARGDKDRHRRGKGIGQLDERRLGVHVVAYEGQLGLKLSPAMTLLGSMGAETAMRQARNILHTLIGLFSQDPLFRRLFFQGATRQLGQDMQQQQTLCMAACIKFCDYGGHVLHYAGLPSSVPALAMYYLGRLQMAASPLTFQPYAQLQRSSPHKKRVVLAAVVRHCGVARCLVLPGLLTAALCIACKFLHDDVPLDCVAWSVLSGGLFSSIQLVRLELFLLQLLDWRLWPRNVALLHKLHQRFALC